MVAVAPSSTAGLASRVFAASASAVEGRNASFNYSAELSTAGTFAGVSSSTVAAAVVMAINVTIMLITRRAIALP